MQGRHDFIFGISFFVMSLLVAFQAMSFGNRAFASDFYVLDHHTGIAMHGYDLVAFFTRQESVRGQEQFEVEWNGYYWHFVNAANADRFRDAPETFLPQFNGYGAFAVAKGKLAEGNPLIWALYEHRLFFFHSERARNRWVQDPAIYVESGQLVWKNLQKDLAR